MSTGLLPDLKYYCSGVVQFVGGLAPLGSIITGSMLSEQNERYPVCPTVIGVAQTL
jgi:hypothetical protein